MGAAGALLGSACAAAGVLGLRRAWSAARVARPRRGLIVLAWLLLGAGVAGWLLTGAAWDKALALAALAPSLSALAVLGLAAPAALAGHRRVDRPAACSAAGAEAGVRPHRVALRTLCVGPLAGACATAVAVCVDARLAGSPADRLVAATWVTPAAWAVAGMWAATDPRLLRVAAALAAVTGAATAAAVL